MNIKEINSQMSSHIDRMVAARQSQIRARRQGDKEAEAAAEKELKQVRKEQDGIMKRHKREQEKENKKRYEKLQKLQTVPFVSRDNPDPTTEFLRRRFS